MGSNIVESAFSKVAASWMCWNGFSRLIRSIHQVCNSLSNVYYFPFLELQQSMIEKGINTLQEDGRHVTAHVIDQIGREFLQAYTDTDLRRLDENKTEQFWIPRVDRRSNVVGKLYTNGDIE